jgi:hypothetical protein
MALEASVTLVKSFLKLSGVLNVDEKLMKDFSLLSRSIA